MTTYPEIQQRIADASAKQDFDEVTRLAQIASQLKNLDQQKNHLLAAVQPSPEALPTVALVTPSNGSHPAKIATRSRPSARGGLTVEFTTKGSAPIRVCERTSADTLVVLMERILTHFGMPGLEKLTGLRVNRGPLVSRDPRKDYAYGNGQLYTNHRIPGTNFYVLTHSANEQKVRDVRAALRMLGFPESSIRVSLS